jgi:hypothetical protein
MDSCIVCRTPLPPQGHGQRRLYCSRACRERAYRERQKRADEGLLPPIASSHPIDQLVESILTAQWLVANLRRLGRDIGPQLGLRCTQVADDLEQALRANFPEACEQAQSANDRAMKRLTGLGAEHPVRD